MAQRDKTQKMADFFGLSVAADDRDYCYTIIHSSTASRLKEGIQFLKDSGRVRRVHFIDPPNKALIVSVQLAEA